MIVFISGAFAGTDCYNVDDLDCGYGVDGLNLFEDDRGSGPNVGAALLHLISGGAGEYLVAIPLITTFIEDLIKDDDAQIRTIAQEQIVSNNLGRFHSKLESIKLNLEYLRTPYLSHDELYNSE